MRNGAANVVLAALTVGGSIAYADSIETSVRTETPDRLEASAFVGIGFFGPSIQLGDSFAVEQAPGNAPLVGARLTALLAPNLAVLDANRRFQFAIEAEVDVTASNTRSSTVRVPRMQYFSPVIGWRAHVLLRYADTTVPMWPHLLIGAGGATVVSESPYMRKETDPVAYYGGGFTLPLTRTFQVRVDARHGIMPARNISGYTHMAELQLGFGGSFGFPEKRIKGRPAEPLPEQPIVDETDSDRDGLPDHIDRCPDERETVNGRDDGDGCPEPDADADSVIGDADQCPTIAEDLDGFQDDDGCPEADNDKDGIDDVRDTCPNESEIRNGFDDDDGCPDSIPSDITKLLVTASVLKFEPGRARVSEAAQRVLAPVLDLLLARKNLRVAITGRPATAKDTALARRRADAVKWYLIDQGAAEKQFETRSAPPGKGNAVELTLIFE